MAKGIGPLLLLGGAAALFLLKKKEKEEEEAPESGMKIASDCRSMDIVDIGDAFEFQVEKLAEVFQRHGINPQTLEGLDPEKIESYMVELFSDAFPQCQWPPADPVNFKMGKGNWKQMIDEMKRRLGEATEVA